MAYVPWNLLESGLIEDAPLADPRHYSAIRSAMDPYEVLSLGANATVEDVKTAYHRLARTHHPDRGGDTDLFQRISAAHAALVGPSSSVLPYGGALCPSRSPANASRKDVVRCILVAPDASFWLTLDEQEVIMLTRETRVIVVEATAGTTLLCCCFLDDARRLAVGGTQGQLFVATLQHGRLNECPPIAISLGARGPVMALCAPPGNQSPLLCASVDGCVQVLDVDAQCVLFCINALDIHAEALLCPAVPELNDADAFPPEPAVFVGGSDGGAAGRLRCVRLGAACADGESDGARTLWVSEYDAPVFALAVSPLAAGAPLMPPSPALLAVAAGSAVVLHHAGSGAVLRRLVAGDGVLYALAFSPSGSCLLAAGSEEVVHGFRVPAGTRRAVIRLTRSRWAGCFNTATINALAFIDEGSFVSGGYDMACSRWQLAAPTDGPGADGLEQLTVEECRSLIRRAGLCDADLVEKKELHERAREARERLRNSANVRVLPAFSAACSNARAGGTMPV